MSRPLRLLLPSTTWFVTTRCIDARFLLRPDPAFNALLGLCLARACRRFHGISLLGFVALSNHLHLLLLDEHSQLSSFMELLLGTLARAINALRRRRGHVFERRFSAEPVLDPSALRDRWLYLVLNPVRAGLVACHEHWPGLCLFAPSETPRTFSFRRFHHHRYHAARRATPAGQPAPAPTDFYEEGSVTVSPLPEPVRGSPGESGSLLEEVRRWEGRLAQERLRARKGVLGPQRVLAQNPLSAPQEPRRSPRPLCHTVLPELYEAYRRTVQALRRAYEVASAAFRAGHFTVEFPGYTYRPSVPVLVS